MNSPTKKSTTKAIPDHPVTFFHETEFIAFSFPRLEENATL
jgi:hypothetical protein